MGASALGLVVVMVVVVVGCGGLLVGGDLGGSLGGGKTMKTKGDKTIDKTRSKRVGLLLEVGRPRGGYFRRGP